MAAKVVFLDRALATYGSETAETRDFLSRSVAGVVDRMWPGTKSSQTTQLDPNASSAEALFHSIQKLSPQNDEQRSLKSQALQVAVDLGQTRWLLFEQTETSISLPADHFGLLDGNRFRQRRPVRTAECDGDCHADAGRFIGISCDLPDLGAGQSIQRGHPDFPWADAQRISPSRALTAAGNIGPRSNMLKPVSHPICRCENDGLSGFGEVGQES